VRVTMDYGLIKASQRLSEIDLKIEIDGWAVEVRWFRAMIKERSWLIRRHAHKTFELHFAARGDCRLEIDGREFPVPEGSFYVTAPDVYHVQRNGSSGEFVEYSLNCDLRPLYPEAAARKTGISWLRSAILRAPCQPSPDRDGVLALFGEALREADLRLPGYEIELRSLVLRILVACARSMGAGEEARPSAGGEEDSDGRMERIRRFIEDNIGMHVAPADLAEHMNLSEKQVGRIVSRHTGYPTSKYITRMKLRKAKELLATTEITIKKLAEDLGFSSEYYFSSVFRLFEGYPPRVFRASMKSRPKS
jgi:AraC-like DNA-binding protein